MRRPTRVIDREDRRPDRERFLMGAACATFVLTCVFLYVVGDAYRASGWKTGMGPLAPLAAFTFALCAVSCRAYVRSVAGGHVLWLDPTGRTYQITRGPSRNALVHSGGYGDFAALRLETRVRRVYGQRNVSERKFGSVTLDWKDQTTWSFCVEEMAGAVAKPKPWLTQDFSAAHDRARAALRRWSAELGAPSIAVSTD